MPKQESESDSEEEDRALVEKTKEKKKKEKKGEFCKGRADGRLPCPCVEEKQGRLGMWVMGMLCCMSIVEFACFLILEHCSIHTVIVSQGALMAQGSPPVFQKIYCNIFRNF